jgi:hypothetical protein
VQPGGTITLPSTPRVLRGWQRPQKGASCAWQPLTPSRSGGPCEAGSRPLSQQSWHSLALGGRMPANSTHPRPSGELCRKWNGMGCTFPRCRHNHYCSTCRRREGTPSEEGEHPAKPAKRGDTQRRGGGGGHPGHPANRCLIRTPAGTPTTSSR